MPELVAASSVSGVDVALAVFTVCSTVRVFAYLPQIFAILRDTQGATAISYATWFLFGFSNATTAVYGALVVKDWMLAGVFVANTGCCLIILGLTAWKRATLLDPAGRAQVTSSAHTSV